MSPYQLASRLTAACLPQTTPGFGYLYRELSIRLLSLVQHEWDAEHVQDEVQEEEDEAAALTTGSGNHSGWAIANLSICFSPSYQVPVLYLNAFDQCQLRQSFYLPPLLLTLALSLHSRRTLAPASHPRLYPVPSQLHQRVPFHDYHRLWRRRRACSCA